jgi:hypothetical protein
VAEWDRVISGPFSQMQESIVRLIALSLQLQAQVKLASQADVVGRETARSRVRVGQYVPAVISVDMPAFVCLRSMCSNVNGVGGL